MTIAFIAIVIALLLGFAVSRSIYKPKHTGMDREALRKEIERRQRTHMPRKELRKKFVEATRRELLS